MRSTFRSGSLPIALAIAAMGLAACVDSSSAAPTSPEVAPPYSGSTIVWIDSYHPGYEWSMAIEDGLRSVLDGTGAEVTVLRMDTKNITGDNERTAVALDLLEEIERLQPDVVIATDDNAQKYLVVPHLKDTDVPVVFAGVNWDASAYGYPASNVTGMVEVDLVEPLMELLTPLASGTAVGYLSGDTSTDHKVADAYNERFFGGEMATRFVTSFDEFKSAFAELQAEVDILIVANNAGIDDWDAATAEAWILEATQIPTGSRQTWMAPYALVTLGRLGAEQGEWAADAALRIIDGVAPADIPLAENERGELVANLVLADALDVALPSSILRNAEIYDGISNHA